MSTIGGKMARRGDMRMRGEGRAGRACALVATALALTVGAFGMCAPGAAASGPAWLAPQALSEVGVDALGPAIAADARGDVIAAWTRLEAGVYRAYVSFRPAGGSFGAVVPVSAPGQNAQEPGVAFDGAGNAIVVFAISGVIQAVSRPANGSFGAATELSVGSESEFASTPRVIFDSQGAATVAWTSDSGKFPAVEYHVWSSTRPPGGSFGVPHQIEAIPPVVKQLTEVLGLELAADEQGDVFASWQISREEEAAGLLESKSYTVQGAIKAGAGPFAAPATLGAASGKGALAPRVSEPRVAADPAGEAFVVWQRSAGAAQTIEGVFRPAGGVFASTAERVSAEGAGGISPRVAFDRHGRAMAVWQGLSAGKTGVLEATRPTGGGFGSATLLSEAGAIAQQPVVSFAPGGEALVAWVLYSPHSQVQASVEPPGGSFGAPAAVSPPTVSVGTTGDLVLAADGQGDVLAGWRRIDTNYRAEVAAYDGSSPQLANLSLPAGGLAGATLPFSVSASSVWSTIASTTWSFGDGGSASGASAAHAYGAGGSYPVSVTATDALGSSSSLSGAVGVGAPVPVIGPPVITVASQTHPRWREGPRPARLSAVVSRARRAPVGTVFKVGLSEAARLSFAFARGVPGRVAGKRCVAPSRRNRRGRRCVRFVGAGALAFAGHGGPNAVAFQGRLAGAKRLPVGSYKVSIAATDSAGRRSRAVGLRFVIVR